MTETRFDVLAIGNAIVDVLAHADDAFLTEHRIEKGAMTLVDEARAQRIYDGMPPGIEISGGSVANTAVGLASLGGRAAYMGKVRDDQLGGVFAHDIRAAGVAYDTPPARGGPSSARCLIVVTPDAQRSMNTYLGAAVEFSTSDLDADAIAAAQVTYLEGYLYDPPEAKRALEKAAALAKTAGRKVALTLSDAFCVDRHRADFQNLIDNYVDILFANEQEVMSLYEVAAFDDALQAVRGHCAVAALTRSGAGSVVLGDGEVHVIDAEPVDELVDTTGAGDLYAAGFLFGITHGADLATCGALGSVAAAEVISHFGARPEVGLKDLMAAKGFMVRDLMLS